MTSRKAAPTEKKTAKKAAPLTRTTSAAAAPKTLAAAARAAAAAVTKPPVPVSAPAVAPPAPTPSEDRSAALRKELAELRGLVEQQHASTLDMIRSLKTQLDRLLTPLDVDDELEASVTSLRRLLSELVEQRLESVLKVIADVRGDAGGADGANRRVVERLDAALQSLGALQFVAEPMDIVDPVIHAIVEERSTDGVPGGLVVATIRPGYRTARGRVLSKAAVAVSRG